MLKNFSITVEKLSFNQYKLTCWFCTDFQQTLIDVCSKQFGYVIIDQAIDQFNVERHVVVSCKDAWGHFNKATTHPLNQQKFNSQD